MQGQQGQQAQQNNGMAVIKSGVYRQEVPFVGRSISDVRKQMSAQWNIDSNAQAFKGKNVLDESYIIQDGDQIEFHRRHGEKGA